MVLYSMNVHFTFISHSYDKAPLCIVIIIINTSYNGVSKSLLRLLNSPPCGVNLNLH